MSGINKVIGIGLPKSGTSSLATVLNNNNIPTIHFGDPRCEEITQKIYEGKYSFSVLNEYMGITNAFEMLFPQIDKTYPRSKFIHTIRDKEVWLTSAEKHWENMLNNGRPKPFQIHHHLITFGTYLFNKDRFSFVYDMHYNLVNDYFKDRESDLLSIDITKDKEYAYKVCDFLNVPVVNDKPEHVNEG